MFQAEFKMFSSELEIVEDLINGYGEDVTLGELKDMLQERSDH